MNGRGWARLALLLGGGTSISANVAHAASVSATPGAIALSVTWPVMVAVAIELLTRVDWPAGWWWLAIRTVGVGGVGGVAALVSYRHMSALMSIYGEDSISTAIGPLAIDGLLIMATSALVVTSRHPAATDRVDQADLGAIESIPQPDQTDPPAGVGPAPAVVDPDPDPVPPNVVEPIEPGPVAGVRPPRRSAAQVQAQARELIAAGVLPARPSGEALRKALRVSPARARVLRDELRAGAPEHTQDYGDRGLVLVAREG